MGCSSSKSEEPPKRSFGPATKDTADAARAFDVIVLEGNQAVPRSIDFTQFFELLDRLGVPTSREDDLIEVFRNNQEHGDVSKSRVTLSSFTIHTTSTHPQCCSNVFRILYQGWMSKAYFAAAWKEIYPNGDEKKDMAAEPEFTTARTDPELPPSDDELPPSYDEAFAPET